MDYESEYSEKNKKKYIGYIARIAQRLYNENGCFPKLKIIIIYTADVKHGTTDPYLDMDAVNEAVDKSAEQIAINLYKAGDSIEKISECVGLSLTRLEEIFAPLKA
ncbi:MAG: hypothetical protein II799_04560 [Lachnospiraceae bacterium]|nr:hypothetical protein [Lachnospiraceae bacterium]